MRWVISLLVATCIVGAGFFVGLKENPAPRAGAQNATTTASSSASASIVGPLNQTYTNTALGFSMRYPAIARSSQINYEGYLPVTKTPVVSFTLPRAMFDGTNLGEAGVYIGATTTHSIVSSCMKISRAYDERTATSTELDGQQFAVFTSTGVGAGNIYEETAMRTVQNGFCVEIIELLHSGNIGNYPDGSVTEFDHAKYSAILDEIVQTYQKIDR